MDGMIGQTLNRYKITNLLGEGGMGAVYKGRDMTLQRDVAIKIMHPHFARQPNFQERFIQEARTAARMNYPGIVQVYDFGQQQGILFIVMEFIPGSNLGKMLRDLHAKNKWVPLAEGLKILEQVALAIDFAHKQGILHRDIKPDNIMLKPAPNQKGFPFQPVITDLGLAKLFEGGVMTQEGVSMGTPAYMSPEQALGQTTDARSDVYSLGILLFELAVGQLPFPARTISDAIAYHTQKAPPAPRSLRPDLSEALEKIILKAVEKDPARRFSTADELAQALANLQTAAVPTAVAATAVERDVSLSTQFQESLVPARGSSLMAEFGESGETSQDKIIVLIPDKTTRSITIKPGGMKIGRETDNDIVIDDQKSSRHHARIDHKEGQYYIVDLESTNGTFLGNTRLLPGVPQEWRPDTPMRIGDIWLRLVLAARKASTTVAEAAYTRPETSAAGPQIVRSSAGSGRIGIFLEKNQFTIEPGIPTNLSLGLLNQGAVVDHFRISLEGIPPEWVTLPTAVQLLPGDQQTVSIPVLAPRAAQYRAGRYDLKLRVTSQSDPGQNTETSAVLTLGRFAQFSSEIHPERFKTGANSQLKISNLGNAPDNYLLAFKDRANELTFSSSQDQLQVPEGQSAEVSFSAKLNQRRWIGGEKTHAVNVQIKNGAGEQHSHNGEVISHALFPVWLFPALATLCLLLTIGSGLAFATYTSYTGTQTAAANQTSIAIGARVTQQLGTMNAMTSEANTQIAILSRTPTPSITPSPTITPSRTFSPTPSQTSSPTITRTATATPFVYDKVSLSLNLLLAKSIKGQVVPQTPPGGADWEMQPEHILLTLNDYQALNTRYTPQIKFYQVKDYTSLVNGTDKIISTLNNNIRSSKKLDPGGKSGFPYLPPANARQMLHSNPVYIKFKSGTGLRYITYFAQSYDPINNKDLFYTFQGLTSDGRYYISAVLPVNNAILPTTGNLSDAELRKLAADYDKYLKDTNLLLNGQNNDSFVPSLNLLDDLMKTIQVR